MDKKNFYLTTTLPYVNAAPHIGFALELVQADIIARYRRKAGDEIVFNTGTDEHGQKIYQNAEKEGKDVLDYVRENAEKFKELAKKLNISFTNFIRTTDDHHVKAAQEFWCRCAAQGDVYKKNYQIKYCVGCELEKMESELVDGKCPIHPNLKLEIIEEENYFFRFSKYQEQLLELYGKYPDFIVPAHRLTEMRNFVASGLQDFSVSRLKSKMPWGVPVPGDEDQVMYVWFDALVNYVSTLGWPEDEKNFEKFWGTKENPRAFQVAGKDNLRQQAAMWQAMLMSAGLPSSRRIMIHGFINSNGQKMSKSLGNVIDPFEAIERYGSDALRFWLAHDLNPFEDGDFTWDRFKESYQANLANGLGNFTARVLALGEGLGEMKSREISKDVAEKIDETKKKMAAALGEFKFHEALGAVWNLIGFGDRYVNDKKPWAVSDRGEKEKTIFDLIAILDNVAAMIEPFLPGTAEKITKSIVWEGGSVKTKRGELLFTRLR